VKSSVFTFFNSATNDQVISLDVLSLRFIRYNATGVSTLGASQFSADASVYCEASDLAKVSSLLFSGPQTDTTQSTINPNRIPVALAFDLDYTGVLIKTQDGGLIHLNFDKACAGENAISMLDVEQQDQDQSRHQIVALGDSRYALKSSATNLRIVSIKGENLSVDAEIKNFCAEDIVSYRKYTDDVFFVCGRISKDGLKIESIDKLQILSLNSYNIFLETTTIENTSVAGLAFSNSNPVLFHLADRSKGMLTKYDLSSGSAQRETLDNIILKGILNKL
jgi:hypothetical protein